MDGPEFGTGKDTDQEAITKLIDAKVATKKGQQETRKRVGAAKKPGNPGQGPHGLKPK